MRTISLLGAVMAASALSTVPALACEPGDLKPIGSKLVAQDTVSAERLALLIQTSIEGLSEPNPETIEAAIAEVLATSGESVADVAIALAILADEYSQSETYLAALQAVAAEALEREILPAPELTSSELAQTIQEVLDALPENAEQFEIEIAITAVIARSGAPLNVASAALAIVAAQNSDSPVVLAALTNVATGAQRGVILTGGDGGQSAEASDAPQGNNGGNSDY